MVPRNFVLIARAVLLTTTLSLLGFSLLFETKQGLAVGSLQEQSNPAATVTALWQKRESIAATLAVLAPQKLATLNAARATATSTPTSTPIPLPLPDLGANPHVTALTALKVRTSASITSKEMTVIAQQTQFEIVGQANNCARLQIRLQGRQYGWISQNPDLAIMNKSCEYVVKHTSADAAFLQGDYPKANQFYNEADELDNAVSLENQPSDLLFRRLVASLLSNSSQAQNILNTYKRRNSTFRIFPVSSSTIISGNNFRLMEPITPPTTTFGYPLIYRQGATEGALWWNARGSVLIRIEQKATYQISFELQHAKPAPIQLELGVDGQTRLNVTLTKEDNSWENYGFSVLLLPGFHTVDIRFTNDEKVNNIDRNAIFRAVEIQPE